MTGIRKHESRPDTFWVQSSDGKSEYETNVKEGICTCKAWQFKRYCKHLELAKSIVGAQSPLTDTEKEWLGNNQEFNWEEGVDALGEERLAELLYLGEVFIVRPGVYHVLK